MAIINNNFLKDEKPLYTFFFMLIHKYGDEFSTPSPNTLYDYKLI